MAATVLIADDHPLTRDALGSLLEGSDFEVVGVAGNGFEAIACAGELRPDLVLLGLDLDGLAALPGLKAAAPESAVVVLAATGAEDNLLPAIRAGAAGYLLETEPPERLVDFLHRVARGEAALSGSVAASLLERVREGKEHEGGIPDAVAAVLSAREAEVLLLLDEHLATGQIAQRLLISEHTVRSHVKSLLHKLGVSSRRDALSVLAHARA